MRTLGLYRVVLILPFAPTPWCMSPSSPGVGGSLPMLPLLERQYPRGPMSKRTILSGLTVCLFDVVEGEPVKRQFRCYANG
ncbi:hypothetical protein LY76DRAFT_596226 [Colletotrichum caudatum]|nr:hypothetical protein LY76DRAFT_596226 [Colletotrichum caudatum]